VGVFCLSQLEVPEQFKVALSIGTTRQQIISNLRELAALFSPSSMTVQ
jgi:hypothetical protein